MSIRPGHPWRLVAPWYRWPAQGVPELVAPTATRPVLQGYGSTDFVDRVLAQPQRCLRPQAHDHWQYLAALPAAPKDGLGRARRIADHEVVTTPTRKLYQPIHSRFYVVVASLHCDVAGLPPVRREEVGRAGFVVRRRRLATTGNATPAALLERVTGARAELTRLVQEDVADPTDPSALDALAGPAWSRHRAVRLAAAEKLLVAQAELAAWAAAEGVSSTLEGWVADPEHDGIGAWQAVAEEPDELTEVLHPMLPLVAPPGDEAHDAADATLYFGGVPTASRDLTVHGEPRFDDEHVYEIRCVVERADPCVRPGPLVWSLPTERYLVAPTDDLMGTSNRPVTVRLPDVPRLMAQAATLAPGRGAGVRFSSPPGSPRFTADGLDATKASPSGAEICSFAIPLITIVATFVFNLFLGLVVVLFNLWVLLALKLCIPPSLTVGAGLEAELQALPPNIDVDVDVSVEVRADIDVALRADFVAAFGAGTADGLLSTYSTQALLDFHERLRTDLSEDPGSIVADMVYEAPVVRAEVVRS